MKRKVLSAGVIVVRRAGGAWHYLLLRAFDYWDFPKGIVEQGEDPLQAARREVSDCDDVVLFNEDGFITETSIDNIIVEKSDGTFVTPPVSAGLLAGIYRAFLLEQGKITEEAVTIDGLKSAASIAVVNSVRGWRPAVMVAQDPD